MKTRLLIIIGMILVVSGFASLGILSYLLEYSYIVEPVQVWPNPNYSQLGIEVLRWGIFAYLRIGFLIIGYSGIGFVGMIGIVHLLKRNRK